jgi:hypothetical protein
LILEQQGVQGVVQREKAFAWLTADMAMERDMYHYETQKRL